MTLVTLCIVIAAAGDVAATRLTAGASPETESGEPNDLAAALFDGTSKWRYDVPPGRNAPVMVKLAEPFDLTRIEISNVSDDREFPGMATKTVRVEAAPARSGPWGKILETNLKKGGGVQRFGVNAPLTRYLRISLLANHGSMQRFGLDELTAFGKRSKPGKVDFTGVWATPTGEVRLEHKGKKVTGCYGPAGSMAGDSTITGTVDGTAAAGTWREDRSELAGGPQAGAFAFGVTAEGDLSGVWGAALSQGKMSRWIAAKKDKPTITCDKPTAAAPKQEATAPVNTLDAELQQSGRVTLRGLLFRTGSDDILPDSIPVLTSLANSLKAHPNQKCVIEGHTDDVGDADVNQKLSERRAASVKAWLVRAGVAKERLTSVGLGEAQPTRANDSAAGRAANRRVEVAIEK